MFPLIGRLTTSPLAALADIVVGAGVGVGVAVGVGVGTGAEVGAIVGAVVGFGVEVCVGVGIGVMSAEKAQTVQSFAPTYKTPSTIDGEDEEVAVEYVV